MWSGSEVMTRGLAAGWRALGAPRLYCRWHPTGRGPNVSTMLRDEDIDPRSADAAIAEARRRWGRTGAISVADLYARSRLLVGELRDGRFWIHGRGATWEAAFADADARVVRASRRKAAH